MITTRTYGGSPYSVAVLHGGPGAPDYMAPVARELGKMFGVLEPFQSASSLEGQIEELRSQLTDGHNVTNLIGSSWGAVLALFYAARYPENVRNLILIGSAVFDAESSTKCKSIRFERMSPATRATLETLTQQLQSAPEQQQNELFRKTADCYFESDHFDPITRNDETIECQYSINKKVWDDFKAVRDSGALKNTFSNITAPTVVIHGDFDPHPIEGIAPFLNSCLPKVDVHLLMQCGHFPWIERHARNEFFNILREELEA